MSNFVEVVERMPEPYRSGWRGVCLVDSPADHVTVVCHEDDLGLVVGGAPHFRFAAKQTGAAPRDKYLRINVQLFDGTEVRCL